MDIKKYISEPRKLLTAFILLLIPLLASASTLDPLRHLRSELSYFDFVTRFIVLLLVIVVLGIAILAYLKNRSKRLLLVVGAFALFALKWLLKVADLFLTEGSFVTDPVENVFELLILASLFIAIFKK